MPFSPVALYSSKQDLNQQPSNCHSITLN